MAITPELYCTNLNESLDFYVGALGFLVVYERPEDKFAMLEFNGARLMLEEITPESTWVSPTLKRPFGQGMNLQIDTQNIETLYKRAFESRAFISLQLQTASYRINDTTVTQHQFIVHDPDGYQLRFAERVQECG